MRLHVSLESRSDSLTLVLDSGSVSVPGEHVANAPVVMTALYLHAFIAGPGTGSMAVATFDSTKGADRRTWRALAVSDSTLLADSLRYGERRAVSPMRLSFHRGALRPDSSWLVLQLTGNALEMRGPLASGQPQRVYVMVGAVRVYACAGRSLDGRLDPIRLLALQRSYGLSC
jgi:hypothetical protein